tara:strand:- start:8 stop:682 length:675 start_codon:yes stop_codon:yes gene_type:complete
MSIVPAKPSASVLLLRDHAGPPEVLLVRRNSNITFHGGAWVFPGGKVDAADAVAAGTDDELLVARHAAAREVHEETGVQVDHAVLRPFSHWTTPSHMPKRFATWFFVTVVAPETVVTIDDSEIVDYRWVSMADALELRAREEIELPAPAFVTLTRLHPFAHARAIVEELHGREVERYVPRVVKLDDGRCALYQDDAGYEAVDMAVAGPRHRLIMRQSVWEYIRD